MAPEPVLTGHLPTLHQLASAVVRGEVSLRLAKQQVESAELEALRAWLDVEHAMACQESPSIEDDLPYRRAFLELGYAAACRADTAGPMFRFGLNFGHLLCNQLGDLTRGTEVLARVLPLLPSLQLERKEHVQALLLTANICANHHRQIGAEYLDLGISLYQTALDMTPDDGRDPVARARALHGLGTCRYDADPATGSAVAIDNLRQALRLIDNESKPDLTSLILHNLGNAHRRRSREDRSVDHRKAALDCLEASLAIEAKHLPGERQFRATAAALGELYTDLGRPMRAIELFEQALETLHPVRQRREYGALMVRFGRTCRTADTLTPQTDQYLTSLGAACYVAAREALDPERDTEEWASATAGLASIWNDADRLDDALTLQMEVFEKATQPQHASRRALVAADHIQMVQARVADLVRKGRQQEARRERDRVTGYVPWLQAGGLAPYRLRIAEAALARLDALTADIEDERQAAELRRWEALCAALACRMPDTPIDDLEHLEDIIRQVGTELGKTDELLPIAVARLAREADFLRIDPSLVDYYNYLVGSLHWWDIVVATRLAQGDVVGAAQAADQARARTLDLFAAAAGQGAPQDPATASAPPHLQARHSQLIRQWQATLGVPSIEKNMRRDTLMPWLRESFLHAPSWRGHWSVRAEVPHDPAGATELVFGDGIRTATIEFASTMDDAVAFVLLPDEAAPRVVAMPELNGQRQLDWITQWFDCYGAFETRGAVAIPAWAKLMQRLHREIGEACWRPLLPLLERQPVERLVLIPDRHMDSFALQAMSLPDGDGSVHLADRYEVAVCPSLRQLGRSLRRARPVGARTLFIGDPQDTCPTGECDGNCRLSLPGAATELAILRKHRSSVRALVGSAATPAAVLANMADYQPNLLHVATHGVNYFHDPLGSGFLLHYDGNPRDDLFALYLSHSLLPTWGASISGEVLTLDTILQQVDWRACDLAVLNACEVGLSYVGRPRESLHVAAGMLAAGVPSVVAPAWHVAEAAVGLLMRRFYAELHADPTAKLRALTRAQRWLRGASSEEVAPFVTERQLATGTTLSGQVRPFSHMFFWAPFQWFGSPI
jgi:CHAT domain-containing protein/tetratricopeptide (TPR) repeat protein